MNDVAQIWHEFYKLKLIYYNRGDYFLSESSVEGSDELLFYS